MFTIGVPLVFVTISSSKSSMSDLTRLKCICKNLLLVFVSTGAVAAVMILISVNIFPPAQGVSLSLTTAAALPPFQTGDQIVKAITGPDFPELKSRQKLLPRILFSSVFGLCVNVVGVKGKVISNGLDALAEAFSRMMIPLLYCAPTGIGAHFAALVEGYGTEL